MSPRDRKRPLTPPGTGGKGFTLLELVVTMAVALVITAVAIPTVTTNLRIYQLNSTASMVADQFRGCRFEAIRRNVATSCYITPSGNGYQLWTDKMGTGVYDPQDHTTVLSGAQTLLAAGAIPSAGNLASVVGVTGTTTVSGSGSQVSLAFDARGAVTGVPSVTVLYIGYTGNPAWGYRAVVVMPSGSVQVWSAASSGAWQQES